VKLAFFLVFALGAGCAGRDLDCPGPLALDDGAAVALACGPGAFFSVTDLVVGPGVTSLVGLSCVTRVEGDLLVFENPTLADLRGLDNLVEIGGSLEFTHSDGLVDVEGLGALTTVGRDLILDSNGSLAHLTGLDALERVGGQIFVKTNPNLLDLTGLERLTDLEGGLYVKHSGVTSLLGLENLRTIAGDLDLEDNDEIRDYTALSGLTTVGGYLDLNNSDLLVDLEGFASLTSVGRSLYLTRNPRLIDVGGLAALRTIGRDLWIDEAAVRHLDGLSGVEDIGDDLVVIHNHALPDSEVTDLVAAIDHIGGDVISEDNGGDL